MSVALMPDDERVGPRLPTEPPGAATADPARLLFERGLAGIAWLSAEGRIIECNQAFAALLAYSTPEEATGKQAWFSGQERPASLSTLQGPLPTREVRFRRQDGESVAALANVDVLMETGRKILQCIALDLTEHKQLEQARAELHRRDQESRAAARTAHRWLSFLAEASKLLTASLDYRLTLVNVAQLAMPFLCDWCSVDILEDDGSVHRLAPYQVGTMRLGWRDAIRYPHPIGPDSPHPVAAVLATGRSRLAPLIDEKFLVQTDHPGAPEAGSACALAVPLVIRGKVQGAFLLVCSDRGRSYGPSDLPLAEDLGRRVAAAIDNSRLLHEAAKREQELRELAARLSVAEDNERRRLALDLHDSIGQTLSVLKLNLELAGKEPPGGRADHDPGLQQRLSASLRLLQEVITQVRTMTFDLYPAMLDDLGLGPTLHWYAERFRSETGIALEVCESGRPISLPAGISGSLFRVVKELLANVAKHAHASEAVVTLRWERDRLRLVVADDGRGFEPALVWPVGAPVRNAAGLGLLGIRERVTALGGQVLIESEPGMGARVILEAPLPQTEVRSPRSEVQSPGSFLL